MENSDWQCTECGCKTFARVDERQPDGSYKPGNRVRCVECKTVSAMTTSPDTTETALVTEARWAALLDTDGKEARTVLLAMLGCAMSWDGSARILGNVRAEDACRALTAAMTTNPDARPLSDEAVEALEPCPHCGSSDVRAGTHKDDFENTRFEVSCSQCPASMGFLVDAQPWGDDIDKLKAETIAAWNRRAAMTTSPDKPAAVTDKAVDGDRRLWWFLHILDACGGTASASGDPGEWVAAFCGEVEQREPDTYNISEAAGYTRTSHDNRFDAAIVRLTDKGRAAITATLPHMRPAAEPVAIRALEWEGSIAGAPFGDYRIHSDRNNCFYWSLDHADDEERLPTFEAAKAAAQADYEARIRSALASPAPAVTEAVAVADDEETIAYIMRWGGRCRDCADNLGTCPYSGLPCNVPDARKAIQHVLKALNYGLKHGYLKRTPPASPADDRLRDVVEALEPFASVGELVEVETEGFSDSDEFELLFADHLFERITVGKFRRARAALVSLREREG